MKSPRGTGPKSLYFRAHPERAWTPRITTDRHPCFQESPPACLQVLRFPRSSKSMIPALMKSWGHLTRGRWGSGGGGDDEVYVQPAHTVRQSLPFLPSPYLTGWPPVSQTLLGGTLASCYLVLSTWEHFYLTLLCKIFYHSFKIFLC